MVCCVGGVVGDMDVCVVGLEFVEIGGVVEW